MLSSIGSMQRILEKLVQKDQEKELLNEAKNEKSNLLRINKILKRKTELKNKFIGGKISELVNMW